MTEIGYKLSSEEHGPRALVDFARKAEAAGFSYGLISDHYHPWIDRQGQSPFVWSVIGGIAQVTDTLRVGTGVTCPTIRIHPALVAQAAATSAAMLEGRFFLGVGSGEALNEHILGDPWPPAGRRLEMLEEAIGVMRLLWQGGLHTFHGDYYRVENARIYSLPEEPIHVYIAASGNKSTKLAARVGDGLIGVAPNKDAIRKFEDSGGTGPKIGELQVCYAPDEAAALKTAVEWWPNIAMGGQLGQDLALPSHYESVAELVSEQDVAKAVSCGPDPETHIQAINEFVGAGYDHVTVHQIGPDQDGFFAFYRDQILPKT